jgi:hypothetical protein
MQENLPIYGIDKKDLRDFTTTENDMKRMTSRFPLPQYRMKGEDLIKPQSSDINGTTSKAGAQSEIEDNTFEQQMDDLQKNVEIRNKQFQESKNFADKNEDDDDDDEEEEEGSQYVAGTG